MIVSSAFAGSAFSADISKQRSHDFTSCYAGVATAIQFSNTNFGATLEHTGAIFSSPPGSVQNLGPFPTVKPGAYQGCIRESGTYKVKWFTTS